jgi:hypothetical protein
MSTPAERAHGEVGPHGAIWCGEHNRWECSKNSKRSKSRCHDLSLRGRDACKTHVGESTELAKAKGEANIAAFAWTAMGDGIPVLDAPDVMLRLLHMSWMRVHLYAERLRGLVEGTTGDGGLVGPTYAAGRDGARVETGEQIRAMAKLEGDERDRCARLAKTCHDMGIAEQQIVLAQGVAARVVAAFRAALDAPGPQLLPALRDLMLRAYLDALELPELTAGEAAS